ncbi:MAG: glycosyltransferase family 2 protein [Chitinophagales bacterium]
MNKPTLDLILPCYNPLPDWEKNVFNSYIEIRKLLPDTNIQVIIVNDGSSKGINDAALLSLNQKIPDLCIEHLAINKGKGNAIRKGIALGKSDLQIFTDIDFPYAEKDLANMYENLLFEQADIAVGSRETDYYKNVPFLRVLISRLLRSSVRMLLQLPTSDTQTGLKGFNNKGKKILLKTKINRYLFDLEFLYLANQDKTLKIITVPVSLKDTVTFSKISWKQMLIECANFMKILFYRFFSKK